MARPCSSELISSVDRPPMRSEIAPQICRLSTPRPEQQREHRGAALRRIAEVGAERDQMVLRHRHGHAAQERGQRPASRTPRSAASRTRAASRPQRRPCRWPSASPAACFRKMQRQRNDHGGDEHAIGDHGRLPAEVGDRALEDRRPDRAGEIEPARQQRERRAAAAIEPAADIDIERRVEPGIAEQPDEQAVAEIELPGLAERRDQSPMQTDTAPKITVAADAVALRERPHHQAADGAAEPGERACERRRRARAAEIGGDRLQADRHDPQRAERRREQHERYARDHPGGSRLDAWN